MTDDAGRRWGRRWGHGVVALVACAGALALASGASVAARELTTDASLVVTYTTPTSIQVKLGDGTAVSSGSVIPAGTYMVTVEDDPNTGDLNPDLTMTGPGVSLSNNLNSTGMGIDATSEFGPYTLQTSSTYSIEDSNLGASTLVTFTTSATATATSSGGTSTTTGSSSGGSTSSGSSTSAGNTSTTASSHSSGPTTTSSPSSSKTTASLGSLLGTVSTAGKPTLTHDGKSVKTLKAGSYTVVVEDHSTKAGLILGTTAKHTVTVSGLSATGKSTRTVVLTAGMWFFEASSGGPKTDFTVTG